MRTGPQTPMTPPTSSSPPAPPSTAPPPPYEAALSLEASILHLVLKRNRAQHRRARYYRALGLVLLSVRRHDAPRLGELVRSARAVGDAAGSLVERSKGSRSGGASEERWGVVAPESRRRGVERRRSGGVERVWSPEIARIRRLRASLSEGLPEILSRILHAASALCVEMSRGYFLPLCTVCLACVSRIRSLLMRLGREGSAELRRCVGILREASGSVGGGDRLLVKVGLDPGEVRDVLAEFEGWDCDALMERFLEENADEHFARDMQRKKDQILRRGGSNVSGTGRSIPTSMGRARLEDLPGFSIETTSGGDRSGDVSNSDGSALGKDHEHDFGESVDVGSGNMNASVTTEQHRNKDRRKAQAVSLDVNEGIVEMMKRQKKKGKSKKATNAGQGKITLSDKTEIPKKPKVRSHMERKDTGKKSALATSSKKPVKKSSSILTGAHDVTTENIDVAEKKRHRDYDMQMKAVSLERGDTNRDSKKKKTKKNKRKSKKDIIDDIFDGL